MPLWPAFDAKGAGPYLRPMNIYYHSQYNIDLGLLNRLHPFDGRKFSKVHWQIKGLSHIKLKRPEGPVPDRVVAGFVSDLLRRLLSSKRYILNALEVPYIPLIPFSVIDKRILLPMRWAVQGTIDASRDALTGVPCWNLSGGYHHASPRAAEGFCIYNDIGIAYEALLRAGELLRDDNLLLIDVDAHHGNGNAYTFMDNRNITILDIYNDDIYPQSEYTKERVDVSVPLHGGTPGDRYLAALESALKQLRGDYRMAYVIAGTDVLDSDKLGGFKLTVEDIQNRDALIYRRLNALSIPFVFLGGGGYSKQSADAIVKSITNCF
jgi:histone deacetylase 11